MAQYKIEYMQLSDICGRFASISQVMDRNSETLGRMSGDMIKGMGNEARTLSNWAAFCSSRKDIIRRTSDCLQNAISVLQSGEKTVYGQMTKETKNA